MRTLHRRPLDVRHFAFHTTDGDVALSRLNGLVWLSGTGRGMGSTLDI